MISFLHITQDNKFFDVIEKRFETDARIENCSIVITLKNDYQPKFIGKEAKVQFVHIKDIEMFFKKHSFDVVFFHSLSPDYWCLMKYINPKSIVIWWGWGGEMYHRMNGLDPMIQLDLYKPITKNIIKKCNLKINIKEIIKKYTIAYLHRKEKEEAIQRIDYFQPVILEDYKLMCKNKFFKAKLFYYNDSILPETTPYKKRDTKSAILVGNSATATNNHFDILQKLETLNVFDREFIVPYNYGEELYQKSSLKLMKSIRLNINFITDFMPRDSYFKLINSCSYAIFGIIRQQAMGNIYHCISHGIKLFLYSDSVVYRHLKNYGYIVFSIDDMKKEDLENPLTIMEHEINTKMLRKECEERNTVYEQVMSELNDKIVHYN